MANIDRETSLGTNDQATTRRGFLRNLIAGGGAAALTASGLLIPGEVLAGSERDRVPWGNGKYQTFPRIVEQDGVQGRILQEIDLGTLGPDVDTIFGLDFRGDVPTGALVLHQPAGEVLETRVVGIKRADLETVQFQAALGGDRFDVWRVSKFGGDATLDAMARLHAQNTARKHQKVVYIGDLGPFEDQWGQNEGSAGSGFLPAIIRAQRPAKPDIGIPAPDFVQQRQ